MTGRTHLTIGIAVGLALSQTMSLPLREMALITAAAALGSLLPDIDHPQSMLSGWIPGSFLISVFTRHRGFTHSILFCMLVPAVLWVAISSGATIAIPYIYPLALVLGMVSHLIADMLTPAGVPLLFPIGGMWKALPGSLLRITKWAGLEFVVWLGTLALIGWLVLH